MTTRKALRAPRVFGVVFSIGLSLALMLATLPAWADAKTEATAKALQKKAMDEDYLATEFGKANDKLEKAVAACGADKCSAPLRAQLRRDLGVVQIGGQIDKEKGIGNFVEAMKADASIALDPDLRTKDLDAAWAEAKKRMGGGGGAAPAGGGGGSGGQPAGDFTHEPAAEQQIRTPIPVYVEYSGEEQLVKVIARYKGFGMTDWKTVELKKMGEKGWGALLPCADVQQGTTLYYIQGFNAANDPVAVGGDRNNAYKVKVTREKVAEPPHLPNASPPTQCADTGDCPPNFPGCKKAGPVVGPTEATGKDGGEFCEEDTECKSKECKSSKCTDYDSPSDKKVRKLWVGLSIGVDYTLLPSADDVCRLNPPSLTDPNSLQPTNDSNYYCVTSSGDDYPYRPLNMADANTNPRGKENTNLVVGTSDKVSGGGALGNVRVMASIDYALNMNVLIGARLGYVLLTYPGQAAKDDGKTFPPVHLELRGTYLIGQDALAKKVAPFVMVGGGVSTFETSVKVSVVETVPGTGAKVAKDVDAWQLSGPAFITFGGGARIGLSERAAFMLGLRVNLAFGNAFAPSAGPDVGIVFGF